MRTMVIVKEHQANINFALLGVTSDKAFLNFKITIRKASKTFFRPKLCTEDQFCSQSFPHRGVINTGIKRIAYKVKS